MDFATASRMQPNNADTLYSKGETEINLGLFKEAFLTLRQALQLKPQHVEAMISMGRAYRLNGDAKNSLRYLDMAVQVWFAASRAVLYLYSSLAFVCLCLYVSVSVRVRMCARVRAVRVCLFWVCLRPPSPPLWLLWVLQAEPTRISGYQLRQLLYTNIGLPKEALENAQAGKELRATDETSLSIGAISLHTLGRFQESLKWYVADYRPGRACGLALEMSSRRRDVISAVAVVVLLLVVLISSCDRCVAQV